MHIITDQSQISTLPANTARPCYICNRANNPIVAVEFPIEQRYGRPLLPEGIYRFARCRFCSTLYVDSEVTDDYLLGVYDQESLAAVEALGADPSNILKLRVPEFQHHWYAIKKIRRPRIGDQLLDMGCQTGDFGTIAQGDGVEPYGLELSVSYAQICRQKWGGESRVHAGPIKDAPFNAGQFQYITAFETLEHMCDPRDTLRRLAVWLAPDGILAISVPSSDYFHFKFWLMRKSLLSTISTRILAANSVFYSRQVLPHTHIYNFSLYSLALLLEQSGFTPLMINPVGWHGLGAQMLNLGARALRTLSLSHIAMAPSLFAVAKLRQ